MNSPSCATASDCVRDAPDEILDRFVELPPLEPVGSHPCIVPVRPVRLAELAPRHIPRFGRHLYQRWPTSRLATLAAENSGLRRVNASTFVVLVKGPELKNDGMRPA